MYYCCQKSLTIIEIVVAIAMVVYGRQGKCHLQQPPRLYSFHRSVHVRMALTRIHRVVPLDKLRVCLFPCQLHSDSAVVVAVEVEADVAVVSCVASSLLQSLSSARPWLYKIL